MRLATRLALVQIALLVLVLATYGAYAFRREEALFERDIVRDHRTMAEVVGALLEHPSDDPARLLRSLDGAEGKVEIRLLSPDEIASRSSPAQREQLERDGFLSVGLPGGQTATWRLLETHPQRIVEVIERVEEERRYLRQSAEKDALVACALVAAMVVGSAVLGWWLVGRPVTELSRMAEVVGSGDFRQRLGWTRGDELGELAMATDRMSERLATEIARRAAVESQLRHADRLTTAGTLAAGIAHEVGTPLNIIQIRAEMIGSESASPEISEGAAVIGAQAARITAIIQQLLSFARPRKPRFERLELRELLGEVSSLLRPIAKKRGCTVVVEGGDPVWALADRGLLLQAVLNLAMNAVQASPPRGTVELSIARGRGVRPDDPQRVQRSWVQIAVRDHGAGIPAEIRERVFEPFFTTKPPGEGTGLGLSVTWGIARDQGGFLALEDAGPGARFVLSLPDEEGA